MIGEKVFGEQVQHKDGGVGQDDVLHQVGNTQFGVLITETVNGLHGKPPYIHIISVSYSTLFSGKSL